MLRALVVSTALAVAAGAHAHAGVTPPPVVAQEEPPAEVVTLAPGERFSLQDRWDLEIQGSFTVPSLERPRYSEVRMTAAFRNTAPRPLAFARDALAEGRATYPRLQLVDAAEVVHPLPMVKPDQTHVPGSNLGELDPGVTARWTVGFQVPTIYAGDLTVQAVWEDRVVAAWDLDRAQVPFSGWPRPPEVETISMGTPVDWGEQLVATPIGYGLRLCGNPAAQHTVLILQLDFLVENRSRTDALWTGHKYPEVPGVAIWGDGGSGHAVEETSARTAEPLLRHSSETVVIPPHAAPDGGLASPPESRALVFTVPRDGRFGPADLPPQAVMLFPPEAEPRWLPVSGAPTTTPAEAWCGRFAPSIPFDVVR